MASDELASPNTRAAALPTERQRRRITRRTVARRIVAGLGILALALVLLTGWYVLSLRADYRETRTNIAAVQAMLPSDGSSEQVQPERLPELEARLATIEAQVRDLDARLDIPVVTSLARDIPWVGDRVRALEAFLAFSINTTALAHDGAALGNDVYTAWAATGFSGPADPSAPTWLEAVQQNRASIDVLLVRFDSLLIERQQLRDEHLPSRATRMLATLDPLLARAESTRDQYIGLLDYYPVAAQALGAQEDGRYLVLLLNSQEIRPIGGFPGTYAIITLREGRLADYEFHNMLELDALYLEHRTAPIASPGPLAEHLKVEELLPRDIGWEPDFPTMARTLLDMHAQTGDAPLQGIVAVTDTAVRDALRSLGPLQVTIQGEPVTVDADNVINTIEAYRLGLGERHKDVVRVIGSALLDRIRSGGFDIQRQILGSIRDSANRREIQLYATDPTLQAEVSARGWDGALLPDPTVPTLALTLANVVGNKASHHVTVESDLRFAQLPSGHTRVTWVLDITHNGDPNGNIYYNGFHRTWLYVYLPAGSLPALSRPEPEPPPVSDDPRALGYHVELDPGATKQIRITFDLPPGTAELRLRRQPGANPLDITLSGAGVGCEMNSNMELDRDMVIDLQACAVEPV